MDEYVTQLAEWHSEQLALCERRVQHLAGERFQKEVQRDAERRTIADRFGKRYDEYTDLVRRRDLVQDMLFPTDNVDDERERIP